jgi:predicted kinase
MPLLDQLDEPVIVAITGISASGKSTVADLLARRFERGVHVRGDVFRRMIVSGRHQMDAAPTDEAWRQLRLRYSLAARTAEAYFDAGFSVVVQDIIVGPVLEEFLANVTRRPLIVVVLAPTPEVAAQRDKQRTKTAYDVGALQAHDLDVALRTDTPRTGLWIDSSAQTPEETVTEILTRGWDEGRQ